MSVQQLPFLEILQDVSRGNIKTPQKEFLTEGDIPVVDQGKQLIAGYTNDPARVCKVTPPVIVFGDHTRAIKFVDFEFAMGADGTKVLAPRIECDLKYFYHALRATRIPDAGYSRHFKFLKETKLPVPTLSEQKRIAAILDAADALRAKRRETLTQLDTLLQSTFLEMFGDPLRNTKGWEMGKVGDLLESANYGTSKKAHPEIGAYPVLRMNNITYEGGWNLSELKYIDLTDKEATKHLVHKGQILFNRTNSKELVGKTAVYRLNKPMAFAGYLVRGVANEHANPEYIGAFMNTPHIKLFLRSKCKNIVGMANINAKEFQAIPIPKPPIDLQNRFATIVQSVEQQKSRLRAHLDELDTLFASLQARAFAGEL